MLFKYFTDKDTNSSVAVNAENVKFVRETSGGCKLFFNDGSYILTEENYLEVVARLNEKK